MKRRTSLQILYALRGYKRILEQFYASKLEKEDNRVGLFREVKLQPKTC